MQTIKNKTLAIIIATILVTSMAITLVDLHSANAHIPLPWQLTTYAYIYAAPNLAYKLMEGQITNKYT